jgi:hypothetical protein
MPTGPRRQSFLVVLAAFAAALLAGCFTDLQPVSPSPAAAPSSAPSAPVERIPILIVETHGGECPDGPCGTRIDIGSDGSVHRVLPTEEALGTIPKAELDALTAEIERANFALIESRPFTGECPTAYDGQETIYTFHLPTGNERIATCAVAIDPNHPLFLAVGAAMRTFTSEGP